MTETYNSIKKLKDLMTEIIKDEKKKDDPVVLGKMSVYIFQTFLFEHIYKALKKDNIAPLLEIWEEIPSRLANDKDSHWRDVESTFNPAFIKEKVFGKPEKRWELMQNTCIHRRESRVRNELDENLYRSMQKRNLLECPLDDFYIRYLFLIFTNTKEPL